MLGTLEAPPKALVPRGPETNLGTEWRGNSTVSESSKKIKNEIAGLLEQPREQK